MVIHINVYRWLIMRIFHVKTFLRKIPDFWKVISVLVKDGDGSLQKIICIIPSVYALLYG